MFSQWKFCIVVASKQAPRQSCVNLSISLEELSVNNIPGKVNIEPMLDYSMSIVVDEEANIKPTLAQGLVFVGLYPRHTKVYSIV